MDPESLSETDLKTLREQLGREPIGAVDVARRCPVGHPAVIRTHPLTSTQDQPAPFPTLYWLTCPALHKRIAQFERTGGVSRLVDALREDSELRTRHAEAQAEHASQRWALLTPDQRSMVKARGWEGILRTSGLGGIRSQTGVKCLHLQVAYHLVWPIAVGAWIEKHVDLNPCVAEDPPDGGSAFASKRGLNTLLG